MPVLPNTDSLQSRREKNDDNHPWIQEVRFVRLAIVLP